jgi:hypothetical protein
MTQGQASIRGTVQVIAGVEIQLSDTLSATSEDIAHSECLGMEDRAEVYSILQAIQADSELHRQAIQHLTHRLVEGGDA